MRANPKGRRRKGSGQKGSSLELSNTRYDPFNSISEILLSTHLRCYRTTAPTHGRIITDSEILGYLGQRPVATPLDQIQRYFARLILPTPHSAQDFFARHFVLTHDFVKHTLRPRLYNAPLIAWMLPTGWLPSLSDPVEKGFTAEYRALTLGFIIAPKRWLVTR